MISYIKGTLVKAAPGFIVVDSGGLGYKIFISTHTYPKLPQIGETILIHTSFVVRELSHTLYGFLAEEERELFEEVTQVSGIGPKIGLSLIGHLSLEELYSAIGNSDVPAITRIPGIGKKTAERLIIEMRDRLPRFAKSRLAEGFAIQMKSDPQAQRILDAMNALMNLGYNHSVAQKAIKKTLDGSKEALDLPLLITSALKNI